LVPADHDAAVKRLLSQPKIERQQFLCVVAAVHEIAGMDQYVTGRQR
jgi:hypothetical protein